MDAGGTIGPTNIVEDLAHYSYNPYTQSLISTNAADCMKQHLGECVEFVADIHTITKVIQQYFICWIWYPINRNTKYWPVLVLCWPSVVDRGTFTNSFSMTCIYWEGITLTCYSCVIRNIPANTRHWPNIDLMFAHRLWCRPNSSRSCVWRDIQFCNFIEHFDIMSFHLIYGITLLYFIELGDFHLLWVGIVVEIHISQRMII